MGLIAKAFVINVCVSLLVKNAELWNRRTRRSSRTVEPEGQRDSTSHVRLASSATPTDSFCAERLEVAIQTRMAVVSDKQKVEPSKLKLVQVIFKNPVRTSKRTQHFTITKINWLTLFKEIIAVYTENHTKIINRLDKIHRY
jgi:hypothetical protein